MQEGYIGEEFGLIDPGSQDTNSESTAVLVSFLALRFTRAPCNEDYPFRISVTMRAKMNCSETELVIEISGRVCTVNVTKRHKSSSVFSTCGAVKSQ